MDTDDSSRPEPRASAMAVLGSLMRRAAGRLADVVVPPVCVACRTPLAGHDSLCGRCWQGVAFIRPPLCDRLGLPMPYGGTGGPLISAAAAADPPVYDRARAVAVFEAGVLRDLVHGLKYADRHEARRLLGRWLAEAGRDLLPGIDVIVPVPMTRWRLLRRQFNQSAILAREVAVASGIPTDPLLLLKTRSTPPQVGLTRHQRRLNVRGAFAVAAARKAGLAGRNVLLVDDVITTGATVEACARALKAGGAARVDVLALGLAPPPAAVSV